MSDTTQARYESLKSRREPFLTRARECSAITIPALLPPQGHNSHTVLPAPYQGLGARAVVSLASRLMIAMYPPGMSSFRLQIPSEILIQEGKLETDQETERGLALSEKAISNEIERKQWRQPTHLTLQYLITTGNALEQVLPDNRLRVFRLDQYVVVRDMTGDVTEVIIEEYFAPTNLPDAVRSMLTAEDSPTQKVPIYTSCKKTQKGYEVHQEVAGKKVAKSTGTYDVCPFNALRWTAVIGEDYGRGKCEEHLGDLQAVDGLSKAMLDGAALASRHVMMIRPNAAGGLNLRRRLAAADNGEYVVGNPEDIGMLAYQNAPGLQVAKAELAEKKQEIASAFLMNSSVQRQGERVTAYELKMMAEELEGSLGGAFSMLSRDMQSARLNRLIIQMQAQGKLPPWPEGVVEPTVLTGLESLGREQDVQRVGSALQFLQGLPPEILDYVRWEKLLGKAFNGLSLEDAVNTEDEVAQKRQQRQVEQGMGAAAEAGGAAMAQQAVEQGGM